MGQLAASCIAQASDNSLYVLAFAYDLNNKSKENKVVALLKSNAPSTPSELKWEVVSTIRTDELYSFDRGFSTIQCIVAPNGSFLAWNYYTDRPVKGSTTQSRPGGFRYDPALPSSGSTTGKGGWVNVDSPISLSWTNPYNENSLISLKNAAGGYDFHHVYSTAKEFVFSTLNTASTPNVMENSPVKWDISTISNALQYQLIENFFVSANKFFIRGIYFGTTKFFATANIPENGPLSATVPSFQYSNYSAPIECTNPIAKDDKFYHFCQIKQNHGTENKLYSWDGTKAAEPIAMSQLPLDATYTKYRAGIFGDASKSFMLVQTGNLNGDSTYNRFGNYKLSAVQLTGAGAGSILDVPNNITVKENISFSMYSESGAPGSGNGGNGGNGGSGPGDVISTIVGISVAVRWVIGVASAITAFIFIFGMYRLCVRRRKAVVVEQPTPLIMHSVTTTTVHHG